jgi:ABC-type branched-subunit amino acid transport system substrate-binding protein
LIRLDKNFFPACAVLSVSLALAGCGQPYPESQNFNTGQAVPNQTLPPPPSNTTPTPGVTGKAGGPVALLVPLTGDLAPVGQALENAAKLAFPADSSTPLDIRDTQGTPAGAAAAAQAAVAAGDGLILGPLTSAEAHAVAPIATAANVNVLAFTNDSSVDAPGVWALGISPDEQVKRALSYAAATGRTQVAAILPDTDFGHALGAALQSATSSLGEPAPSLTFYDPGFSSINDALKQMSDYADRGAVLDAQIKAAKEEDTAAGFQKAAELSQQQPPPPSFNALFIGAIDGGELGEMANLLPYYDVSQPQVQFIGPAPWGPIAAQLGANGVFRGAIYAAADPAAASEFDQKYNAAYGAAPPAIADVAFDAAAIARLLSGQGGYTSNLLTAPDGFTGADGVLQLGADGSVQRGLAVFETTGSGPNIVSPAPASLTAPAS